MKRYLASAVAAVVVMACGMAQAGVIASSTFPTDGTVADYTGAGKIFAASQSADTPTMPVAGGQATIGWPANSGVTDGSVRTDFGASETLVSVKVDITPNSYAGSASSFRAYFSDSADVLWTQWSSDRAFGSLRIDGNGLSINGAAALPFATGATHTLSVYLNKSGATQSFTGPDNVTTYNVNDGTMSVFDGTTLLAGNVASQGPTHNLTNMGLMVARNWNGFNCLTNVGNLTVRDDLAIYPIPEPACLGLLGLGGLALVRRRH